MNFWNRLGIDPTNDIREIKRAYAEQLKIFHPEDHPEEFESLQDAYQSALRYAKLNMPPAGKAGGNKGPEEAERSQEKRESNLPARPAEFYTLPHDLSDAYKPTQETEQSGDGPEENSLFGQLESQMEENQVRQSEKVKAFLEKIDGICRENMNTALQPGEWRFILTSPEFKELKDNEFFADCVIEFFKGRADSFIISFAKEELDDLFKEWSYYWIETQLAFKFKELHTVLMNAGKSREIQQTKKIQTGNQMKQKASVFLYVMAVILIICLRLVRIGDSLTPNTKVQVPPSIHFTQDAEQAAFYRRAAINNLRVGIVNGLGFEEVKNLCKNLGISESEYNAMVWNYKKNGSLPFENER